MKKNVFNFVIIIVVVINFISCTKEKTNIQQINDRENNLYLTNIVAGKSHNDICYNTLKVTNKYKDTQITAEFFDSIFLEMYPEFTQEDLDSYKTIILQTRQKSTTQIYNSIRTTSVDENEKEIYIRLDTILLNYKMTNDSDLVIQDLENLIETLNDNQTINTKLKYCGLSTIDVSKNSIELWTDINKNNKFLSGEAIVADINTFQNIVQSYIDADYSLHAIYVSLPRISGASAYASLCTHLNIDLGGNIYVL